MVNVFKLLTISQNISFIDVKYALFSVSIVFQW